MSVKKRYIRKLSETYLIELFRLIKDYKFYSSTTTLVYFIVETKSSAYIRFTIDDVYRFLSTKKVSEIKTIKMNTGYETLKLYTLC